MPQPLKLALRLVFGLLALLLVAATILVSIDLGRFSATAERQLSALLEREVAFDGELNVRVGRTITIAMSQARIGGGSANLPDLLQVGAARVELATLPLLLGRVEVLKARLSDIDIALVERPDGSDNFSLPQDDQDKTDDSSSNGLAIRLADAELQALSLRYDTPKRKSPLELALARAAVRQQEDTTLSLQGQLQGEPLQLEAQIVAGELADGAAEFALKLAGQLGDIRAEGNANLDDLLAPRQPRGEFRVTGPNARYLTDLLRIDPFTEGPLDLTIALKEQDQQLAGEANGSFGEFTLHSTALVDLPLQLDNAQASLRASGPDLAHLALLTGMPESFNGPFAVSAEIAPGAEALQLEANVSTSTLSAQLQGELPPGAELSAITLQVSLAGDSLQATGDRLGATGLPDANYRFRTQLKNLDGAYRFDALEVDLGEHQVRGAFTLKTGRGYQVEDLTLTLDSFHKLAGRFTVAPNLVSGRFDLQANSPDLFRLAERPPNLPDDIPGKLALEARGEWADGRWELHQFDARFANSSINGSGSFDDPPDFERTDLKLDVDIGSLAAFSALAGRALPNLPARLGFRLLGDPDSVRIEQLHGQLGIDEFSGSAAWIDGTVPQAVAILIADRLDLSPFFPPAEPEFSEEPALADTEDDARAIPDQPLSLAGLEQRDLRLSLQVGELIVAPRRLRDLVLRITVEDGAFYIPELKFKSTAGNFNGELGLIPDPEGIRWVTEFSGDGMTLGLPAANTAELAALPDFSMNAVLAGKGATTRELAASLDGYFAMAGGQGRIRSTATRYFASDFITSMVNTVNPFRKVDEYTNIRCSALAFTARKGVLEGKPLAILQTDRFSAELRGTIDLASEGLDINIRTIAEKGLGVGLTDLVNPFTRIGGTLARPRVELDPQRAVKEGTFYIATLGLSLVAKRYRDSKLAGQDRCKLMLDEANPTFEQISEQYRHDTEVYR